MPTPGMDSEQFGEYAKTLTDSDFALVAAERYDIELQFGNGPLVWNDDLHELAKEAVDLQILPRVAAELEAAHKEFVILCARQNFDQITGEELQNLSDAHTRFWEAKKAYESVSNLIIGHFHHLSPSA